MYKLEEAIGVKFNDKSLLELAVTHSSFARDNNHPKWDCNERLEFLGDGFLDAVIGEKLYKDLPEEPEGTLSKVRALTVCEEALYEVGVKLEVGTYLKLSRGEENSGGRDKVSVVADAVEAIIGAVYLDQGYEEAKKLVLRLFADRYEDAMQGKIHTNYKSDLQEYLQHLGPCEIDYRLNHFEGPAHDRTFYIDLYVDGEMAGNGVGKSKKEAEQKAAKEALSKRGQDVL